jgi:hypothetical protein
MSTEIDSACMDEITCPWCGYQFSDSWEMDDDDWEICEQCGKHFSWSRETRVTYSSQKFRARTRLIGYPPNKPCAVCAKPLESFKSYLCPFCSKILCETCERKKTSCCKDYTQALQEAGE